MATIQLRVRIDSKLKKKSDEVLKRLGLDAGSFVSMALTQLVHHRALPFAVTDSDAHYFASEYEITPAESAKAGRVLRRETTRARRQGKLREIKSLSDLTP